MDSYIKQEKEIPHRVGRMWILTERDWTGLPQSFWRGHRRMDRCARWCTGVTGLNKTRLHQTELYWIGLY